MRVFVAGATGVLGRALLPPLLEAGHIVFGLARSPEKRLPVEQAGAAAVDGDVLDAEAMRRAVAEAQPEAIVNLATAIPLKLRVTLKDWEPNDRVRVEGTTHLLAAAQEAGVRLFVQESVGYVYAPRDDVWIDENSPRSQHALAQGTAQMEDIVRASDVPATLLRFGMLYAPDAWHTQQSVVALRRGLLPVIGDGAVYMSPIHAFDAAQAIMAVLANPEAAAGQTFNVVDNDPARMRDVLPYAATLLHAPAPRHVPPFMAKMIVGPLTVEMLTASYRISNARIRRVLGFTPRYPTYREIWAQIAQEIDRYTFAASDELP